MNFNFPKGRVDLLIIAGEHSGDEHAGELVRELLEREPSLSIAAIGGKVLQAAGAHLIHDLTQSSVIGFWEVVKKYGFFKKIFNQLLDYVEIARPKAILFVDYPGFNLRFAKALYEKKLSVKGGGSIPLHYYISPQIWAWKAKRRFEMAKHLDGLAVLFPFELDCYKDTDLPVEFVGHPFLRKDYQAPLEYDAEGPVLLLPGSRKAPVEKIFPKMLAALSYNLESFDGKRFTVIYPSEQIRATLLRLMKPYPSLEARFDLVAQDRESPTKASVSLMSAGTISLISALAGMPGALMYVTSPLTYWMAKVWVKIKYLGMASLLLDREVYKEFIQSTATPEALNQALQCALLPEAREKAIQNALALREKLGAHHIPYPHPADWLLPKLK